MRAAPQLVVAVPARDEGARIAEVLRSIRRSVEHLRTTEAWAGVVVVVAADACRDDTAAIAGREGARVVPCAAGRVGAARAAAVRYGLEVAPRACWIATTDADSRVPVRWLRAQLDAEREGTDLLLGTVRPDGRELSPALLAAWSARHVLRDGHDHVHGANLGVRTATYLAAGGFEDVEVDEDVRLVQRCRALGARVRATGLEPVTTSARLRGRVPGGFSGHLRALAERVPAAD